MLAEVREAQLGLELEKSVEKSHSANLNGVRGVTAVHCPLSNPSLGARKGIKNGGGAVDGAIEGPPTQPMRQNSSKMNMTQSSCVNRKSQCSFFDDTKAIASDSHETVRRLTMDKLRNVAEQSKNPQW